MKRRRCCKLDITCYENLANAIILQAIGDYKKAKKMDDQIKKDKIMNDVNRFVDSEYFKILTNISPDVIRRAMDE